MNAEDRVKKPYPDSDTLCNECKNWYWCTEDGPGVQVCTNYCPKQTLNVNPEIDPIKSIEDYLARRDWRVAENANMPFSLSNLLLNLSGKAIAEFWLNVIYKGLPIDEMHRHGLVHIHDLGLLSPYCFTGDTTIQLADGTSTTLKELFDQSNPDTTIYLPHADLRVVADKKAKSFDGETTIRFVVRYREKKDMIEFETEDGRKLGVSTDHAVLVKRGDSYLLIRADEVKDDDDLVIV